MRGEKVESQTENMKNNETGECGGSGGKRERIVCHDSSIRTSIVRERERGVRACACTLVRIGLIVPPSSRATI